MSPWIRFHRDTSWSMAEQVTEIEISTIEKCDRKMQRSSDKTTCINVIVLHRNFMRPAKICFIWKATQQKLNVCGVVLWTSFTMIHYIAKIIYWTVYNPINEVIIENFRWIWSSIHPLKKVCPSWQEYKLILVFTYR